MPTTTAEIPEINRDFLYGPDWPADGSGNCTHEGCIAGRTNMYRMREVQDDPRVLALTKNPTFFELSFQFVKQAIINPMVNPDAIAVSVVVAAIKITDGTLDDPNLPNARPVDAQDLLAKAEKIKEIPGLVPDLFTLLEIGLLSLQNCLTIGVGLYSLYLLTETGEFVQHADPREDADDDVETPTQEPAPSVAEAILKDLGIDFSGLDDDDREEV